jgi:hypothetical protein
VGAYVSNDPLLDLRDCYPLGVHVVVRNGVGVGRQLRPIAPSQARPRDELKRWQPGSIVCGPLRVWSRTLLPRIRGRNGPSRNLIATELGVGLDVGTAEEDRTPALLGEEQGLVGEVR